MKNTNSRTGWIITILILVIINITTLFTIWHTVNEHHPPKNGKSASNFLIKQLAFDSIQKEKYLLLVQQHQQDIRDIKEQAKESKGTFFSLVSDTTISDETIKAQAMKVFEGEYQIAIITFHHFQQVRALCTPVQKKKFDSIIKELVAMMGPQNGPHQPPHEGNPSSREGHHPPPPDGEGFPPPPPDDNPRP